MKPITYKLFTLLLIFTLGSCTEIIDIKTNSSDPQIIVEGGISLNDFALVYITKSIDLNQTNKFPTVEKATVIISNDDGESETLTETASGVYESQHLKGKSGKKYALKVISEQKQITSSSIIPSKVPVDSFKVINSVYPGAGPATGNKPANFYIITLHFTDPAQQANFYRIIISVNGVKMGGNRVFSDEFNNGNAVTTDLVMYNEKIKKGDVIGIEFQCIEKNVFDYFNSIPGGSMGLSPANPNTNLTGVVLGYFSAHTSERLTYVVK